MIFIIACKLAFTRLHIQVCVCVNVYPSSPVEPVEHWVVSRVVDYLLLLLPIVTQTFDNTERLTRTSKLFSKCLFCRCTYEWSLLFDWFYCDLIAWTFSFWDFWPLFVCPSACSGEVCWFTRPRSMNWQNSFNSDQIIDVSTVIHESPFVRMSWPQSWTTGCPRNSQPLSLILQHKRSWLMCRYFLCNVLAAKHHFSHVSLINCFSTGQPVVDGRHTS